MDKPSATIPIAQTAQGNTIPDGEQEVQPQYLTYRQAETLTGLSRVTLWRIVSAGHVKAARIGRAVRISRKSLVDFMERASDVG